jgi:hypothetical protein
VQSNAGATGPLTGPASSGRRIALSSVTVTNGGSITFLRINQSRRGARGSVVVEALCYKPEGRGFETRCDELIFFNIPNPFLPH